MAWCTPSRAATSSCAIINDSSSSAKAPPGKMDSSLYPVLEFDPTREALIEPSRLIRPRDVPEHCVICFFKEVIEHIVAERQAKIAVHSRWEDGRHPIYEITHHQQRLAFYHPGVGGALAAGLLEE